MVLPYFAMFIAVWSALVLKHWKRVEKTTALQWGMIGFEDEEAERPQFVGEKRPSAVTGKRYTHFPTWKRAVRGVKTQGVIISLVLVVLALIACIYTIKFVVTWTTAISYNFKGVVSAFVLFLFCSYLYISIFDFITVDHQYHARSAHSCSQRAVSDIGY